ncbi:MAG: hypothetical protein ACKESB_02945 [Candidatus Hodgkinia cicadicola]
MHVILKVESIWGERRCLPFEALRVSGRLFPLCTGTGVVTFISGCVGGETSAVGPFWTWRLQEVLPLTCGKVEELQYLKHKVAQLVRTVSPSLPQKPKP